MWPWHLLKQPCSVPSRRGLCLPPTSQVLTPLRSQGLTSIPLFSGCLLQLHLPASTDLQDLLYHASVPRGDADFSQQRGRLPASRADTWPIRSRTAQTQHPSRCGSQRGPGELEGAWDPQLTHSPRAQPPPRALSLAPGELKEASDKTPVPPESSLRFRRCSRFPPQPHLPTPRDTPSPSSPRPLHEVTPASSAPLIVFSSGLLDP